MSDWIELNGLEVDCIVGVLDVEQRTPQKLIIDVQVAFGAEPSARSADVAQTIDYAVLADHITRLAQCGRWRLLESLSMAIARYCLAPPCPAEARAHVESVSVRIRKPNILPGVVPAVRVERGADWLDLDTRMLPPATWVDVLEETPRGGAYRVHVEPGKSWAVPAGASLAHIAGQATADGQNVPTGHAYAPMACKNLTAQGDAPASFLVISHPPLDA